MNTPAPRTLRIGSCAVVIDDAGRTVTTTFPDGSVLVAHDDPAPEHLERARSLGYGSTWDMNRDHDLAHGFLAAKAGLPFSASLHRAALGGTADTPTADERQREEAMVLTFQRFVTSGDNRWDACYWLAGLGDLDDLAAEFRSLVGG